MKSKILPFFKKLFHLRNVALFLLLFCINFRVISQCVLPTISSVEANPPTMCWTPTVKTTLTVTGDLGNADHWAWYKYSCGGTLVGTGQTVDITPSPGTVTYYVRGEGGCVTAGETCSTVMVTMHYGFTAEITGEHSACVSTILTATTDVTSPGYAWYKDEVLIPNQTNSTLVVTQAGKYNVEVTNVTTGCKKLSDPFSVISVSSMPSNKSVYAEPSTVCPDKRVLFGIDTSEPGVLYQLRNDNGDVNIGDPVSGTNGVTIYLSVDNLQKTTTFNVLARNGNCTVEMESKPTVTVGIFEPSITSVTAVPAKICNGASTTLTVSGNLGCAANWAWYESSCGGTFISTGPSVVLYPDPGPHTYYVRAEGGTVGTEGTCSSTTVTVNESHTASITGGEHNACMSTILTATTDATNPGYVWYKDGGLIADQTNYTLLATQTGDYTVKVTSSTTGCERTSTAFTVSSISSSMPLNKAVSANLSTICSGTKVSIGIADPENGILYQLRNDNGDVNIGDPVQGTKYPTVTISAGTLTETTTFNVLATKGNCILEMNDKPKVTVNNTAPSITEVTADPSVICPGTSTTLTVSGSLGSASEWKWYSGSCGGIYERTGTSITVSPTETTTYYVRGEGVCATPGGDCSNVTVSVNSSEATPVAGTLTKTPDVSGTCEGINVSAALTSGSGGNGTDELQSRTNDGKNWSDWVVYTSGTDISITGKTGVEIRTRRLASSCTSSEYNIVNWEVEATPVIDNPGPQAANGSYPLQTITGKNLVNAKYYSNSQTSGGVVITGPITSNMTVWIYDSTVNGCSDEESFLVTINALLAAPKVGTINQPTCSSSTGSVALSGLPSSGSWTLTGKSSIGTVTKTGSRSTTTVSGLSAGTTYTFIVTNASGSSSLPSGDVVISPQPQAPEAPAIGSQSFCGSATEADLPQRNGTYSYKWYSSSTSRSSLSGSTRLSTGIYYVNQVSGDCESSRTMVIVTINALPTVFRVSGGGTYCGSGPALTVKLSGSRTGVNYQLYLNGSPVAGAIIPGTGSAISFINQFLEGTYTVKAVNAITNCQATMTDRAVITVSETPTASSLAYSRSSASNCNNSGSATIILLSATPGGRYSSAPSGLSINSSTGTINFARSNPGTYTVTYTVSNTCGIAKTTTTVTVTKCTYKNAAISNSEPLIQVIAPNSVKFKVYPNPFSDRIRFEFISPVNVNARIDVYDITGRMVKIVFNSPVEAGVTYIAEFKPNSAINSIFLYSLTIGDEKYIGKLIYKK